MLTDWLIVGRLAAELEQALRGARIRACGRTADDRFGLRLSHGTLAIDAFGPTPIASIEEELPLERSAGWIRTMADSLEGLRIERVRGRRGDRLLALDCSARSRFGVESRYRLVAELVPRFGNIVLLKDDTVVSAAKEFTHAANARRTTVVGEAYEPPPLPAPKEDAASLAAAFEALAGGDGDSRASAALRGVVPLLPRLVADSLVAESRDFRELSAHDAAERCVARATAIVSPAGMEALQTGDVYTYRDDRRLVQCHVVPLAQFGALTLTRDPALLPLLSEAIGGGSEMRGHERAAARRAVLLARIEKRRAALELERAALERERADAAGRDALRAQGTLLYAHLAEVPARATSFVPASEPGVTIPLDPDLDAKGNAAAIFKRYRKAAKKLEHLATRLERLEYDMRFAGELAWEVERAEPEMLEDVAESIERLERRRPPATRERARRLPPLEVRLADDARIYVGRSPRGNTDLTFRIARPDDLWFHARATPGAHVILRIDSRRKPEPSELERAASLAAYHSKARAAEKVEIDFTERKHVRRQQNAPPGLVWYTNARTLVVAPHGEVSSAGTFA